MSKVRPRRINVGGDIMTTALANSGRVYLLVLRADGSGAGSVLCLDLAGNRCGQFEIPRPPNYPYVVPCRKMRITIDGIAWLGEGHALTQISSEGHVVTTVNVPIEGDEEIGDFLVAPGGFVVAVHRPRSTEARGRVIRLDAVGSAFWSSIVTPDRLAYSGVQEISVDSGWNTRPMKPWQPEDWQPALCGDPLVICGDRLFTRYFELRSGLGRTYCLDWATGLIIWKTDIRPEDNIAVVGQNEFLIGVQGYGAFDMYLYNRDGTELVHWPRHAYVVVTESGEIRGVEMENCLPSRMHFSVFLRDGTVRKGPHLDSYYTSHPVVTERGVTAFWRNGKLLTVDMDLRERTLWEDANLSEKAIMSRMLLAADGTLAFGLNEELFLVPTELGAMADSPWPCGGGNANGSPVFPLKLRDTGRN